MRCFIALELPEEAKHQIVTGVPPHPSIAKVSWVSPSNRHITLKFLGEVDESNLNNVIQALQAVQWPSFSLMAKEIGVFPNKSNVRVVWVGFAHEEQLFGLQKKIDVALDKFFPAEKDFTGHITLARVKLIKDQSLFLHWLDSLKVNSITFNVDEFILMKSELTPAGPIYTPIERFPSREKL